MGRNRSGGEWLRYLSGMYIPILSISSWKFSLLLQRVHLKKKRPALWAWRWHKHIKIQEGSHGHCPVSAGFLYSKTLASLTERVARGSYLLSISYKTNAKCPDWRCKSTNKTGVNCTYILPAHSLCGTSWCGKMDTWGQSRTKQGRWSPNKQNKTEADWCLKPHTQTEKDCDPDSKTWTST